MSSRMPSSRAVIYLRTLADTGNASLAAARAGVSRDWAYKRRKVDARFDALCRQMKQWAKARLRVQVRRDRVGGGRRRRRSASSSA